MLLKFCAQQIRDIKKYKNAHFIERCIFKEDLEIDETEV